MMTAIFAYYLENKPSKQALMRKEHQSLNQVRSYKMRNRRKAVWIDLG